jgi:hypothetical protein
MKIELDRELVNELKDKLFVQFLNDDLETLLLDLSTDQHIDDIKYTRKLVKAYVRILKYYGVNDEKTT